MSHESIIKGHPAVALPARARSEPELRAIIVQALRASGIAAQEQVACAAGAADIVTVSRDAVIEVKLDLTRKQIQWAVGQVLLYRQAINPQARAIVVGYATEETASLVEWAAAVGVEIVCWKDEGGGLKAELLGSLSALSPQPSALHAMPFALAWNVRALAHSHGITRVADLARFAGISRQSLYGLWRGSQINVSVAMLERLAKRLGPAPDSWLRPGDWFRFENGRLTWNITAVAEQVGLDTAQLAFAANQYPQQIDLYWTGQAKFVFVDTLAHLAAALETESRAFDVGELFTRTEG